MLLSVVCAWLLFVVCASLLGVVVGDIDACWFWSLLVLCVGLRCLSLLLLVVRCSLVLFVVVCYRCGLFEVC